MEEHKSSGDICKGASESSTDLQNYLRGHELALNFARRNRFLIAHRILEQIDSRKVTEDQQFAVKDTDCLIDIHHNFVEKAPVM
jgi:RNA-splicing ligase RtcB